MGWGEYNETRKTPEGRAKRREQRQAYRKAHPEKYRAHVAVDNALRGGRLTKLPCEVCGSVRSHAHHTDYSQPLVVRWLCHAHHSEVHGR